MIIAPHDTPEALRQRFDRPSASAAPAFGVDTIVRFLAVMFMLVWVMVASAMGLGLIGFALARGWALLALGAGAGTLVAVGFALRTAWSAYRGVQRWRIPPAGNDDKLTFARDLLDLLADDLHPYAPVRCVFDPRPRDHHAHLVPGRRATHRRQDYVDRWFKLDMWLVDGTRVRVRRACHIKVRQGFVVVHRRSLLVRVTPNPSSFGPPLHPAEYEPVMAAAVARNFAEPVQAAFVDRDTPEGAVTLRVLGSEEGIAARHVVALISVVLTTREAA